MCRARRSSLLVFGLLVALLGHVAPAAADRTFSTRFSTDDTGNIAVAANTLMSCPAVAPTCAQARAAVPIASGGNSFSNNNFNMTYVNTAPGTVGGVASFDSSSSLLSLPAGAAVLFAGLYWGGDTSAGASVGRGRPRRLLRTLGPVARWGSGFRALRGIQQ